MSQNTSVCVNGIPMPIVRLNRIVIVTLVLAAIALQAPLLTTVLFLLILPAALIGRNASPIFSIGSRLFARQNERAEMEDPRLMRFNNSIAALMLGGAQVAFLLGAPAAGYVLAAGVALAAFVALLGFCVGCFMYYQFKLNMRRLS
jgi:Domain of unknown function (DUF4395)